MVSMRSEKYEKLVTKMKNMDHKCGRWFPSIEDIKKILRAEYRRKYYICYLDYGNRRQAQDRGGKEEQTLLDASD